MDTSLILEIHMFFTAIYGGLIAGFIYDIYRTIRYFSKPSKFITYLGDLLLWTVIASVSFYVLIKINWGELRGYIILGFILGIFIYYKIFSKFIYTICIKIGGVIKKTTMGIISLILYPFKFLKSKSSPTFKKIKKVPIEIIRQTKKYKKIISTKK
ncbi:spore cortex biosynthesis protein YabQ [Tissierella carlieri]|uniref:Spore cortex biosynthesis protein YabQ n=1 Tax=Tissierella carlieri TaxID=689904 RepID=A0ABT1SFF4_9FIRM|nr:spore cortex biosynthesis protein YabQ [Tissierella carlieri]MBU5313305.1 spore cortex biosynthesis protein YabQ [Tissierella carlieri]MCQ4925223.1 spore cortex biosynthesis protein YabQ [Tissierella carlieri]